MKKYLLLFLFSMVAAISFAQKEAECYVDGSLRAKLGETVSLSLQLRNNFNVVGMQFKLVLPEGVSFKTIKNSTRVTDGMTIGKVNLAAGNGVSFTVETDGNVWFGGTDGEIFNITLQVDANAELGQKSISFKDISCAFNENDIIDEITQRNFEVSLTIYDTYNISATSADEAMGSVAITPNGEVENGTSVTATATANDGYSFVNWTNAEGTEVSTENPYTFELVAPVALTANFQAIKYPVVFKNGEEVVQEGNLDYASVITAPETDPTKEGYTFLGWYNGETKFEQGATVPLNGVTYTAKWQINQYTITFDTDGGSEIAPITQDYNTAVTTPAAPTKTGYTFVAWDKEIPATIPAGNITIKATWQINQYTITFDTDGGSEIAPITQDYNTAVTTPAAPTKTGYTFIAWDKEIPATMPAENITIKAIWQINQYTVTFDSNGGTEVAPITQDYASEITAPENPTRVGYEFAGWDKEIPATMPAENITIKATWQINQYTITFDTDGGSEIAAITQDYNTAVTAPAAPTKTGYTFVSWDKEIPATMPAENITIKAIWQINQYTVTFDSNGGTEVAPITQNYASGITAPTAPTRVGYEFAGWDKEIPATMPAEDMTITAQWTAKKFIYTFNKKDDKSNVASDVIELEQTFDTDVVMPTDEQLEWEGHTFEKYVETVPEKVTEDGEKTFTAQYSINTYKVTYYLNDEVVNVAEVKYGEAIPAYEPTVEEGMKFDGWQEEIPAVMPAYDLEIHGTTTATTAIKSIVAKFGESFDVYNVSGRLVQRVNGASDISRIPAGMYIINGTKVVIRKD